MQEASEQVVYPKYDGTMLKRGEDSLFNSNDWRHRVFELEANTLSYASTKEGKEYGTLSLFGAEVVLAALLNISAIALATQPTQRHHK